ncbi:MAG TPA: A24 family peptidase [Vicinamibacterales bacterium]|nr:A24 family peptidase [Vicinamibacterales bacterium]
MSRIFDPGLVMTAAGGAAAVAVDLRSRRVPNIVTLGVAAIGVTLAAMNVTGVGIGGAFAGFVIGVLLMLPGHLVGATGAGDVKLLAALGTLLGPTRTGVAFVYTALAGGALALAVAIARRRMRVTVGRALAVVNSPSLVADIERPSEDNRFAYAPAIAIGALAAALGL